MTDRPILMAKLRKKMAGWDTKPWGNVVHLVTMNIRMYRAVRDRYRNDGEKFSYTQVHNLFMSQDRGLVELVKIPLKISIEETWDRVDQWNK